MHIKSWKTITSVYIKWCSLTLGYTLLNNIFYYFYIKLLTHYLVKLIIKCLSEDCLTIISDLLLVDDDSGVATSGHVNVGTDERRGGGRRQTDLLPFHHQSR